MPLARISVPAAMPKDKVRALADAVHEGLVTACGIPVTDRFQLISALPEHAMLIDPTYPNVERTHDASIVEIVLIGKYKLDQKKDLYRQIVDRACDAGFIGDDILIALIENSADDWSPGLGQCYGDR